MATKMLESFGTSQILKGKDQKVTFGIFYPSMKKFQNGPLKIKKNLKSEHDTQILC